MRRRRQAAARSIAGASMLLAVFTTCSLRAEKLTPPALPSGLDLRATLAPGGLLEPPELTRGTSITYVTRGGTPHIRVRGGSFEVLAAGDGGHREFRFANAFEELAPVLELPLAPPVRFFGDGPPRPSATRYRRLRYAALYEGIDIVYYVSQGQRLQYDLIVSPGADPAQIALRIPSGSTLRLRDGHAGIEGAHEKIVFDPPIAYQVVGEERCPVEVRYHARGDELSFDLGEYDSLLPLVIDPLVVVNSTFFGNGANEDVIWDVALDRAGNIYLTGVTQINPLIHTQTDFPTTPASYRSNFPLEPDECAYNCGFIVKLSSDYELHYGALIHGITPAAIAVDAAEQPIITGSVLAALATTPGVFAPEPVGSAFITKLTADGSNLVYPAQFLAGDGRAIALDAWGNAYVGGSALLPGLPTTPNALIPDIEPNRKGIIGFLLKVSPGGDQLLYGTYLGGSNVDNVNGIAVDELGRPIVVGWTRSPDFPGLVEPPMSETDAYVLRLSADGSSIDMAHRMGGASADELNDIVSDQQGGWLVGGSTFSPDLPTTPGAFQSVLLGERAGWLARLAHDLTPRYITYFGGEWLDGVLAVASDAESNAYFSGVAFSKRMPTTEDAFQDATSWGMREAYFGVLDSHGSTLRYGTYLSGVPHPLGLPTLTAAWAMARGDDGVVYVAGSTTAASFPTTADGLRAGIGGLADGFLVKFAFSPLRVVTPSWLPAAHLEVPYELALEAGGGQPPYDWSLVGFKLPDGITLSPAGVLSGAPLNAQTETDPYQFTVRVRDANGRQANKSLFLEVIYPGQMDCSTDVCRLVVNVEQSFTFYFGGPPSDALPPLVWSTSGTLPPGITLADDGALTGTPTTAGIYEFWILFEDAKGSVWGREVHITVNGAPPQPPPPPPSPPAPAPAPPATLVPTGGGSGGGGAFDWFLLAAASILLRARWRRGALKGARIPHGRFSQS